MAPELKLTIFAVVYVIGIVVVALVYSYIIGCKMRQHIDTPHKRTKAHVNDWRSAQILVAPSWPVSVPTILAVLAVTYAIIYFAQAIIWLIDRTKADGLFKKIEKLGYKYGCGPRK